MIDRAKHCFALPDGSIVDAHEYYELLDAFNSSLVLETQGIRSRSGGMIVSTSSSSEWKLAESDKARAYKLIFRQNASLGGVSDLFDMPGRPRGRPLLSLSTDAKSQYVILIDETNVDKFTKSEQCTSGHHYTTVGDEYPGRIFKVAVKQFFYLNGSAEMCVKVPPDVKIKNAVLPGRYLLVPNLDIEHPERPGHKPPRPGPNDRPDASVFVYEYIPLPSPLKPEEFLDAWKAQRLSVYDWSFKKQDGRIVWTKKELLLP